jgi:hypothetical protein
VRLSCAAVFLLDLQHNKPTYMKLEIIRNNYKLLSDASIHAVCSSMACSVATFAVAATP